jgi:hypothetical protein
MPFEHAVTKRDICRHILVYAVTSIIMYAPIFLKRCLATPGNLNIISSPQYGNMALFQAACNGRVEASRLLLDSKANVNAANKVRCSSWSQCICGMRHGAGIQV